MKVLKKIWRKIKAWWKSILVTLGIIAVATSMAQPVQFSYVRATERVDGSPLALEDIQWTSLYCNGGLVIKEPGADLAFNEEFMPGTYECYATHTDTKGQESDPSNTVTFEVLPGRPKPPTLSVD